MELITLEKPLFEVEDAGVISTSKPFIEANTQEASLSDLTERHIIPVYVATNTPLISHGDFIETLQEVAENYFHGEAILKPSIRISHPVKGRIPEAKHKHAKDLEDWEVTTYFDRMMFVIEVASISDIVSGNQLTLTIGGVKCYGDDNLYGRKESDQTFKMFAGFKNRVCSNMCVWSDGLVQDIKVRHIGQLQAAMVTMLQQFNASYFLRELKALPQYGLTERQFAQLIGRCRMYQYLPAKQKEHISPILFGDQQIGAVCRDYYKDGHFAHGDDGSISLWKIYNLFTGANKTTYIDQFLPRAANAYEITHELKTALDGTGSTWYLN